MRAGGTGLGGGGAGVGGCAHNGFSFCEDGNDELTIQTIRQIPRVRATATTPAGAQLLMKTSLKEVTSFRKIGIGFDFL